MSDHQPIPANLQDIQDQMQAMLKGFGLNPQEKALKGFLEEVAKSNGKACCRQCDSGLRIDGFCTDGTCPYSDWPQEAELEILSSQSHDSIEKLYGWRKRIAIEAHTQTDDFNVERNYDASPYFYAALMNETLQVKLQAMVKEGLDGSYATDDVSDYFSETETAAIYQYLDVARKEGTSTFICPDDLYSWLMAHAPKLAKLIPITEVNRVFRCENCGENLEQKGSVVREYRNKDSDQTYSVLGRFDDTGTFYPDQISSLPSGRWDLHDDCDHCADCKARI